MFSYSYFLSFNTFHQYCFSFYWIFSFKNLSQTNLLKNLLHLPFNLLLILLLSRISNLKLPSLGMKFPQLPINIGLLHHKRILLLLLIDLLFNTSSLELLLEGLHLLKLSGDFILKLLDFFLLLGQGEVRVVDNFIDWGGLFLEICLCLVGITVFLHIFVWNLFFKI